jgi:hypothetical protein
MFLRHLFESCPSSAFVLANVPRFVPYCNRYSQLQKSLLQDSSPFDRVDISINQAEILPLRYSLFFLFLKPRG